MNDLVLKRIFEIEEELDEKFKNHQNISLFSGIGSLPIFYFLLYRLTDDSQYIDKLHNSLEEIFVQLNKYDINISYCTGMAGIAYMLNFLLENGILEGEDVDESLEIMDNAIINYTLHNMKTIEDTDFLHGGLGTAHYLIERVKRKPSLKNNVVEIFEKIASIVVNDLKDFEKVRFVNEYSETTHTTNCGLAHGYIAHIIIFSKFLEQFPSNIFIKSTLECIIECVMSFECVESSELSMFPSIAVNKYLANYNVPLAWCYGDQSIACGFFKASKVLQNQELLMMAQSIVEKTLRQDSLLRSGYDSNTCDTSFCHGITSIAYLHKKGFEILGKQECLEMYEFFAQELLKKGDNSNGLEGYRSFYKFEGFKEDFTFLNGLIGVGIFFIDYLFTDDKIKWDDMLLLN